MASRGEARPDTAAGDVLGPAWSLRWRAPELALLLAERAGAVAKLAGRGPDWLRAEATVVVASCRLGQRLRVVERAIDAVRLAERQQDGATVARLRVELAGCARSAGVPLVGAAVLRPVLVSDGVQTAVRADALVQMAGCLAQLTEAGVIDEALAEADRLYAEDGELEPDSRVVLRALLRAEASGEHRRRGDVRAAVQAAQEGADLLSSLSQPSSDNGEASARIALRLVHGLLDLGWVDEASSVASAELARPVRAPAAAAIGWLSLAMAVRKHVAAGEPKPAIALIRDAADLAERHRLGALRAEALTTLSDAYERIGQLAEALDCLRTAQGVRLRRAREVYAARTKLVSAFGETTSPEEFVQLLGSSPARRTTTSRTTDQGREQAAALLGRFGMRHPLTAAAAVAGARAATPGGTGVPAAANTDVTMVLVDVTTAERGVAGDASGLIGEQVVSHVLDRVRDAAPIDARVARVGGAEFAVLLPSTQAGQAERWVEQLRGAMATVDWSSFTPGLAVHVRVAVAQTPSHRTPEPVPAATAQPASSAASPAMASSGTGLAATGLAGGGSVGGGSSSTEAQPMSPASVPPASTPPASIPVMPAATTLGTAASTTSESVPAAALPRWTSAPVASAETESSTPTLSPASVSASEPEPASPPAASATPRSMFELPTVPLSSPTTGRRSRSEQSPAGTPEAQDALAKALEQWRQSRATRSDSRRAASPAEPVQQGFLPSTPDPAATTGSWSITPAAASSSDPPTNPRLRRFTGPQQGQPSATPGLIPPAAQATQFPSTTQSGPPAPTPRESPAAHAGQEPSAPAAYGGQLPSADVPPAAPPILPAFPILPSLEPERPVSSSSVFQPVESSMARTPANHDPADAISSDPSVRISASDISAAFPKRSQPTVSGTQPGIPPAEAVIPPNEPTQPTEPNEPTQPAESAELTPRRHPDLDAPGLDMWMPGLPPSEPTMPWPVPAMPADAYRSPFADSPFTDPIGDPTEPSRPRHSVDTEAGRSVLSSLGITTGTTSGGGRRRAKEDPPAEPQRHPIPDPPMAGEPDETALQPSHRAPADETAPEPPQRTPADETPADDPAFGDGSWVPLRYRRHELPVPQSPVTNQPVQAASTATPAETAPEAPAGPRPDAAVTPSPERSATRTGGRRRRSVQLADLLTEALMAYQTAQDTNEARQNPLGQDPSASLPGPTSLPTPLAGPVGLDPAVGDEPGYPGPTRHRGDNQFGDSRWHTTRWDSDDRT